jgi:hypothetical protein
MPTTVGTIVSTGLVLTKSVRERGPGILHSGPLFTLSGIASLLLLPSLSIGWLDVRFQAECFGSPSENRCQVGSFR